MRALAILGALVAVCTVAARADLKAEAPADEYFGPAKQSILEIRNRLDRLDAFGTRSPLAHSVVATLDVLQRAIADWQHKYPHDPWLPHSMAHLMHEYHRAGASACHGARITLGLLRAGYPRSAETKATLLEMGLR